MIIDAILNSKYKETLDKGIVFIFQINDLSGIKMCDEDIVDRQGLQPSMREA